MLEARALTGEQVSRLVGAIYDCVLSPDKWHAAVDAIRTELKFANAILASNALPSGEPILGAVAGITPYWLARISSYDREVIDLWGGLSRIAQYPLEEPIVQSRASDEGRWSQNRYYQEWVQPQGIIDAVAIALERDPTMLANVAFGRHGSAGPIRDVEIDGLRLLAPHLRRAVTISKILEAKSIEAASFASILEKHTASMVMLDEQMHVLHINKAAIAMLSTGDPITIKKNRLTLRDSVAERALRTAVLHCAGEEQLLGRRGGTGIAVRKHDEEACIIHVLPLLRRTHMPMMPRAVVALFITRSDNPIPHLPSAAMEALYGLTPAELRVFESIVEGYSQADTATRLGIATSTVKTHLLRVYEKTGAKGQSDLLRLAHSLAAPI